MTLSELKRYKQVGRFYRVFDKDTPGKCSGVVLQNGQGKLFAVSDAEIEQLKSKQI